MMMKRFIHFGPRTAVEFDDANSDGGMRMPKKAMVLLIFLLLSSMAVSVQATDVIKIPPVPVFSERSEIRSGGTISAEVHARCVEGGSPESIMVGPEMSGFATIESSSATFLVVREIGEGFCTEGTVEDIRELKDVTRLRFVCDQSRAEMRGFFIVECLENHETHIPTVRIEDDVGPGDIELPPTPVFRFAFLDSKDSRREFDPSVGLRFTLLQTARRPNFALEFEGSWQQYESGTFFDGIATRERGDHIMLGLSVVYRQPFTEAWNLQVIGGGSWSFVTDLTQEEALAGIRKGFDEGYVSPHAGLGLELLKDRWSVDFRGLSRPRGHRLDDSLLYEFQIGFGFRF